MANDYPDSVEDVERGLNVDVTDCTVFTVQHQLNDVPDIISRAVIAVLFEQALQAISDVIIWCKTKDVVGEASSFSRQMGRTDVKLAIIEDETGMLVAWRNPLHQPARATAAILSGFIGNVVLANGPASEPTSPSFAVS